jgi:hypothetical protein
VPCQIEEIVGGSLEFYMTVRAALKGRRALNDLACQGIRSGIGK